MFTSKLLTVFQGRTFPEKGYLAGYGAIWMYYQLRVPLPDSLAIISEKHKHYRTDDWVVLTPKHTPEDTLIGHLTFALKYEGIELGLLKKLFAISDATEMAQLIAREPTGQYSRKIWFLYE